MVLESISTNTPALQGQQLGSDGYGNVDVTQVDGGDITSHVGAIKGLTSIQDIQNYIDKNIVQFFM